MDWLTSPIRGMQGLPRFPFFCSRAGIKCTGIPDRPHRDRKYVYMVLDQESRQEDDAPDTHTVRAPAKRSIVSIRAFNLINTPQVGPAFQGNISRSGILVL